MKCILVEDDQLAIVSSGETMNSPGWLVSLTDRIVSPLEICASAVRTPDWTDAFPAELGERAVDLVKQYQYPNSGTRS